MQIDYYISPNSLIWYILRPLYTSLSGRNELTARPRSIIYVIIYVSQIIYCQNYLYQVQLSDIFLLTKRKACFNQVINKFYCISERYIHRTIVPDLIRWYVCMDEKSREGASLIETMQLCIRVCSCNIHMLPQVRVYDNRVTTLYIEEVRSIISTIYITEPLSILLNTGSGTFTITQTTSIQTEGKVIGPVKWTGKHTLTGVIMSSIVGHYKRKPDDFTQFRVLIAFLCIHRETNSTGCLLSSCKYITHHKWHEIMYYDDGKFIRTFKDNHGFCQRTYL